MPMPTKQTSSLRSARAAAIVIISFGCIVGHGLMRPPARPRAMLGERFRAPAPARSSSSRRGTSRARARSRPRRCRRRCRACSSPAHRTDRRRPAPSTMAPTVQAGRITALKLRGPKSSTISSTVTIERLAASTASFCTPTMPSSITLPARSAFSAWMIATSGRMRRHGGELLAGERTGDVLDARIDLRQVDADDSRGTPRRAAPPRPPRRHWPWRRGNAPRSRADCGQPFSTASRRRCSEPTPGLPPQENTSFSRAAHADELVVEQVGRHLDQGEVAPSLADDLVPGGVRDEMGEPLHRHGIAVPDAVLHRFGQGQKTRHRMVVRSGELRGYLRGAPGRVKCA